MAIGPGFEIKNCTQWPVTVSLEQIGPLYYGLVQPGEVFERDTGAVWFTIRAVSSPDNRSHIDDWNCILPIAAIVGSVILAAITGGYSAFAEVAASVGASALAAGGAVSLTSIVAEGAVGAAGATALSASTAVKLLGEIFRQNGEAARYGMYAGPPWPFREDRKQLSITGGPVASARPDGKLLLSPGTPLQIEDHFQPIPRPQVTVAPWTAMPGALHTMSMIRHGLMMGVASNGTIYKWDGATWSTVPGTLSNISAAPDGSVWGVNSSHLAYQWSGNAWQQKAANNWIKVANAGTGTRWDAGTTITRVYGINTSNQIVVWDGTRVTSTRTDTWASDITGSLDGTVIHIGRNRALYRTNPDTGAPIQPPMDHGFTLDRISVANHSNIWGVRDGKVYRRSVPPTLLGVEVWGEGTWTQIAVPEPFREVTVSTDGSVCGIANSNNIYTYSGT